MVRLLRIEYLGAVYHVTARGNTRLQAFEDDADRADLLDLKQIGFHYAIVSRIVREKR